MPDEMTPLDCKRFITLSRAITQVLVGSGNLTEQLEACAWEVTACFAEIGLIRIWTFDRKTNLLELRAIAGGVAQADELSHRIPVGISIIGIIAQSRQPYISQNATNDICMEAKDWLQAEQLTSFAGYPLVIDNRLVGVMALLSREPISPVMNSTLEWLTSTLAIVIDRGIAWEELLNRQEALLFRLANHIRNSLDLDKILQATVQEVQQLLNIDCCQFLWCWQQPNGGSQTELQPTLCVTHEAKHPDFTSLLGSYSDAQATVLSHKILNLQPIQIADIDSDPEVDSGIRRVMESWGLSSLLMLPLETRAHQLGAIICGHFHSARPWGNAEVELLQAVTDQLVIAIDQAELYAQTRTAALVAQSQAQQLTEAMENLRQTQAQLVQSEKMSSLGQLVAGVAHEINNPVTFVSGNLSHANRYFQDLFGLLKLYQHHYPEPVDEILERIAEIDLDFVIEDLAQVMQSMANGTDRIRRIVLSLRNFSRLDEAEMKVVDLHEGIESTLLMLQHRLKPTHGHNGIEIVKRYGDLPLIPCFASQINQVFMNLLSNAIDALQNSPTPHIITITTSVHSLKADDIENEQTYAVIRIRDNGMGMTDEVQQKIFDPFFTTKPIGQGTGLGLSISHQIIVKKHKGNLTCHSTPGEGTEFVIEIPLKSKKIPSLSSCSNESEQPNKKEETYL